MNPERAAQSTHKFHEEAMKLLVEIHGGLDGQCPRCDRTIHGEADEVEGHAGDCDLWALISAGQLLMYKRAHA